MKPLTVTSMIFIIILAYSSIVFLEQTTGLLSSFFNLIIKLPFDIVDNIFNNKTPVMNMTELAIDQAGSYVVVSFNLFSESKRTEIVVVDVVSRPEAFGNQAQKRLIKKGENNIVFEIENVTAIGNFEITTGIYSDSGKVITSSVAHKFINSAPYTPLLCESAVYCKERNLGTYCHGKAPGFYECSNICAEINEYAPSKDECCAHACTLTIKEGMCSCEN